MKKKIIPYFVACLGLMFVFLYFFESSISAQQTQSQASEVIGNARSIAAPNRCPKIIIEVTDTCTQCGDIKDTYPECNEEEDNGTPNVPVGGDPDCTSTVCWKKLSQGDDGSCLEIINGQPTGRWMVPCCRTSTHDPGSRPPYEGVAPVSGPNCLENIDCCPTPPTHPPGTCGCACSSWQNQTPTGRTSNNVGGAWCVTAEWLNEREIGGVPDCDGQGANCSTRGCSALAGHCGTNPPPPGRCQKLKNTSGTWSIVDDCSLPGCCDEPQCAGDPACEPEPCGQTCVQNNDGTVTCTWECGDGTCCCPPATSTEPDQSSTSSETNNGVTARIATPDENEEGQSCQDQCQGEDTPNNPNCPVDDPPDPPPGGDCDEDQEPCDEDGTSNPDGQCCCVDGNPIECHVGV